MITSAENNRAVREATLLYLQLKGVKALIGVPQKDRTINEQQPNPKDRQTAEHKEARMWVSVRNDSIYHGFPTYIIEYRYSVRVYGEWQELLWSDYGYTSYSSAYSAGKKWIANNRKKDEHSDT